MNASSSPSATMATTMAFSTNAAGLSPQSFSKMDPIAQSETRIRAVLGSPLIAGVPGDVLSARNLEFQSPAVGLRSKSPNLIHDSEVFRARGEEDISGQPPVSPARQGKSKLSDSGGPPFRARSRDNATRTRSR